MGVVGSKPKPSPTTSPAGVSTRTGKGIGRWVPMVGGKSKDMKRLKDLRTQISEANKKGKKNIKFEGNTFSIKKAKGLEEELAKSARFAPTGGRLLGAGLGGMMLADMGGALSGPAGSTRRPPMGLPDAPGAGPSMMSEEDRFIMMLLEQSPELLQMIGQPIE